MSLVTENVFLFLFLAPFSVLLLLLLRKIWLQIRSAGISDGLVTELELAGVMALVAIIGTGLAMWYLG